MQINGAEGTKAARLCGIDPVLGIKLSRCSKPVMARPLGSPRNNIEHSGQYYEAEDASVFDINSHPNFHDR